LAALSAQAGNLDPVLMEIVDAAIAISGSDFGSIQLLDPAGDLRVAAHRGFPPLWVEFWNSVTKGNGACGTPALARGERVIVEDIEKSPIFVGTPALDIQRKAGIRAVQSMPLISRSGRTIGMLSTHWRMPHRPDDRVLRLLDLLASQAADMIEHAQAEEAIRLSEAKFSGIVSISADAIISVDENRKITLFNEGAERIFGWSSAEAVGQRLDILIPKRFQAVHARHIETFSAEMGAARRMGARGSLIFGVRKNGMEFPADAAISAIVVDGRRILTVALRDITELKEAEAAAKRATQARDDVLGIVAHDLRNPLATITSLAAVLRMRKSEGEIADEIATAANRMNRLIGDLLDVTRIEAGHLSLKPARLPVTELLTDALEGQTPLATASSLELQRETAAELPDIWADRDRLLQVFENLIGNAIKFTKPGGRIVLGASAGSGEVTFSVSDTGRGIAETHMPHVFDRFWQAPGSERRGMGFGLAIVKGIVEAHHGRVWVKSAPGKGSTFYFTIPTAAAKSGQSHAAE
jgi:PAS domain S-box-containing protein